MRAQSVGLLAMLIAVALLIVADGTSSLGLLVGAAPIGGVGQGLAFTGPLGDVSEMAPPDRRGDTVASYYVVVYLGTALPAIGVSALAGPLGLASAVEIFGYVVLVICTAGLAALRAERHRVLAF